MAELDELRPNRLTDDASTKDTDFHCDSVRGMKQISLARAKERAGKGEPKATL
jgi:hypothetical protein